MSLTLQQVELAFGGKPVVRGISIELHPGQVVGLLGPNGAGKTTSFNLVTGMLRPDCGDVLHWPETQQTDFVVEMITEPIL